MTRDVVAVHKVVADLLSDVQERRAWERDPAGYAANRLRGTDEAAVIANLDRDDLSAAALHLDVKRVTSKNAHGDGGASSRSTDEREPPFRQNPSPPANTLPLVGLGYWPDLFDGLDGAADAVDVWEFRIDDCLGEGPFARALRELADASSVAMHSVDLSLGSPEATADAERLARMRRVLAAVGARELSDHLGFSRVSDRSLVHFVPLWRVEECLDITARNVARIQDGVGVRLALENIAPNFEIGGEMTVAEFLNELVRRTGCGVLLDISNLTLCEGNGYCDATAELAALDANAVVGVHLAGGNEVEGRYYDAHAFPLSERDLACLRQLLPRLRNCRTVIIERDGRRDAVNEVVEDLRRLRAAVVTARQ
jgi:uncharacterized protein (UPF0276 family)